MKKNNWQTVVVLGAQWGDEGKGKVTDYYASQTHYVVRFQGGNNAGHTIVHNNETYKLHLLPSGVLHSRNKIVIANGVVIDPEVLLDEMAKLKKVGKKVNLLISERAHLIFDMHKMLDMASEKVQKKHKLDAMSTHRGIWPVYSDKTGRIGIRMVDLINPTVFKKKFDLLFEIEKKKLERVYGYKGKLNKQEIFKKYVNYGKQLKKYVVDTSYILNKAIDEKKKILFEGAQGVMLDLDFGVYPYTTSSNTTVGAVGTGAGVSPRKLDRVIGVCKAYLSRVGGGVLPTELTDKTGDKIREIGGEYGTTTGRPRRVGWLDLVQLKMAVRINGLTSLAITKTDVLNNFPIIKVCTGYKVGNKVIKEMPADLSIYEKAKPIYKTFKGWGELVKVKIYKKLPINLRKYLEYIENEVHVPIEIVSVGAERKATIIK